MNDKEFGEDKLVIGKQYNFHALFKNGERLDIVGRFINSDENRIVFSPCNHNCKKSYIFYQTAITPFCEEVVKREIVEEPLYIPGRLSLIGKI